MRLRAALSIGLLTLALAGCAPVPTAPQPSAQVEGSELAGEQVEGSGLTSDQAERLAVTRFRNFDAGTRAVSLVVPQTQLGEIRVTGWFDFERGVGYGAIAGGGTVWWNSATVAVRDTPSAEPVIPLPLDGWVGDPLDPSANPLATALALVGSLGADRPENPQLLAQSDALWLRSDTVDGVPVDVFAGPSADDAAAPSAGSERARYWVDETGTLLFFEAPVGDEWMTVTFSESGSVSLPTVPPGAP